MPLTEAQQAWATAYSDLYLAVYSRIHAEVKDEAAAVAATNGAMINADRTGMIVPREGTSNSVPTGPAYDPSAKLWVRCNCGNPEINRTSRTSGKPYQGCTKCGLFLQPDGSTKPMGGK